MDFIKQRETSAVKKYLKGKCQGCSIFNGNLLSDCKVVSEEVKKMIMDAKRQEWQAKKGVVAIEV